MRILLLADIHSNWHALSAINEEFDACIIVGDIVDYGANPIPCIEWAQNNDAIVIRGNHDHAIAQRVPARGGPGYRGVAAWARPYHWKILSDEHLTWLARLPVTKRVKLGDHHFELMHATPLDPLDEYLADEPEGWASRLEHVDADFVCVGHTHLPVEIPLEHLTVVNPGSVGQPRDGDPRCSYAIIEDGQVELKRVEYDIEAALKQMEKSGMPSEVLQLTQSVLRTGGRPPV